MGLEEFKWEHLKLFELGEIQAQQKIFEELGFPSITLEGELILPGVSFIATKGFYDSTAIWAYRNIESLERDLANYYWENKGTPNWEYLHLQRILLLGDHLGRLLLKY